MGRNLPMYQYCEELKRKVQNNRDLEIRGMVGECAFSSQFCRVSDLFGFIGIDNFGRFGSLLEWKNDWSIHAATRSYPMLIHS